MKRYILALLILMQASVGWGATETFYVCATGDGTCPENNWNSSPSCTATCATAWDLADFNTAANWDQTTPAVENDGRIGPDDEVIFLDEGGTFSGQMIMRQSGLSGYPITFKAATGDTPVINGTGIAQALYTYGRDYFVFDRLTFDTSTSGVINLYDGSNGSSNVTFQNCTITNSGANGIYIPNVCGANIIIDNCTITNAAASGVYAYQHNSGSGTESYVKNCRIYNNAHQGVALTSNYWIVENNSIHDNSAASQNMQGIHINDVDPDTDNYGEYNIVRYNIVYNQGNNGDTADGNGITLDSNSEHNQVYYNILYNNDGCGITVFDANDNDVYNNTCYGNAQGSGLSIKAEIKVVGSSGLDNVTNLNLKNNLTYATVENAYGIYVDSYTSNNSGISIIANDWYSDTVGTQMYWADGNHSLADWNTHTGGTDLNSDPLFVSAGSDFRLQAGSPAMDAGENLGATYDDALSPADSTFPYDTVDQDSYGSGWEIGAFAHTGYIGGTAMSYTGSAITGTGNEAYVKCYATTGTGNDIRPDDNAPVATDTTDTTTGKYDLFGVTIGSLYFCTFSYYDTTPIAGAQFITAQ